MGGLSVSAAYVTVPPTFTGLAGVEWYAHSMDEGARMATRLGGNRGQPA